MPICLSCNSEFKTIVLIEGKKRNLCNRKYCLECSPFGQHNTRPVGYSKIEGKRICVRCNREYDSKQGESLCSACRVTQNRQKTKERCIDYKGGSCIFCGYDKCKRALEFHHLDPNEKDFGISNSSGLNRSWDKLQIELDKCVLVCSNCHAEIHEGLISV